MDINNVQTVIENSTFFHSNNYSTDILNKNELEKQLGQLQQYKQLEQSNEEQLQKLKIIKSIDEMQEDCIEKQDERNFQPLKQSEEWKGHFQKSNDLEHFDHYEQCFHEEQQRLSNNKNEFPSKKKYDGKKNSLHTKPKCSMRYSSEQKTETCLIIRYHQHSSTSNNDKQIKSNENQ